MVEPLKAPPIERQGEASNYQPVSGVAVAAAAVSFLFATFVLSIIVMSLLTRKPMVWFSLLFIAILGIALSVAARLHVKRSDGTRVGERLASLSWWACVLFGVAYMAYIMANEVAIRQQASAYAEEWFEELRNQRFYHAFRMTLEPNLRQNVNADDRRGIERRFGDNPLPTFLNNELPRVFERNQAEKDRIEVRYLGTREWKFEPTGYKVLLNYLIRTCEGEITVVVPVNGSEGKDFIGRQWHIPLGADPPIREIRRSPYGQLVFELMLEAGMVTQRWSDLINRRETELAYLYTRPDDLRHRLKLPQLTNLRDDEIPARSRAFLAGFVTLNGLAVGCQPVGWIPLASSYSTLNQRDIAREVMLPGYLDFLEHPLVAPEMSKTISEVDRKKFAQVWRNAGIRPRMGVASGGPNLSTQIDIREAEVRISVPVDVSITGNITGHALGRLVMGSRNPELIAHLRKLREEGWNLKELPELMQVANQIGTCPNRDWQILHLESNFEPLPAQGPPGPGQPMQSPPLPR